MANRFEQVDEVVADAITIVLAQQAGRPMGEGRLPAHCATRSFAADRVSEPVPPKDALSGAVRLANELKLAIVVVDPDGVWKKEWGELYRWQDDAEAE